MRLSNKIRLLVLALTLVSPAALSQSEERTELQRQKEQLEEEIAMANKILAKTRQNKAATLVTIETVQQKIQLREELIQTLNREIELTQEENKRLKKQIDTLKAQIEKQKADYAKMIQHARQSQSTVSRLMFIFASEDFNQALRRVEYLKQYARYRKRQVDRIRANQRNLKEKQEDLRLKITRKKALKGRLQGEKERLSDERLTQKQAIAEYKKLTQDLKEKLKAKQAEARKVEQEIERLIALEVKRAKERARRRALEEEAQKVGLEKGSDFSANTANDVLREKISAARARREAARAEAEEPAAPGLTTEDRNLAAQFEANRERLPWPLADALLVGRFGTQRHPVVKSVVIESKGIDLATDGGAPVRSVFKGRVSNVVLLPNGFRAVIINHGVYFSVYQNLTKLEVASGQTIDQGTVLGRVARDPGVQQNRLHFEVWKNTEAVNPLTWLAPR